MAGDVAAGGGVSAPVMDRAAVAPIARGETPYERAIREALVAEARLRWGLDPALGLQVIAGGSLVGVQIEPSRPLLVVPLATLRAGSISAAISSGAKHS